MNEKARPDMAGATTGGVQFATPVELKPTVVSPGRDSQANPVRYDERHPESLDPLYPGGT
ncbi:hypothetical protein ACIHFE_19655 [Streptomyces sp. NPDC052396]|uniref:hypothetical protein n=1 Tax=Streptomyces sp. NPDC052396 TaxID=3365689 RepID=UPI0037D4635B